MKINSIKVKNALPVRNFEIEELANMVFLAGPNGIGKSRLIEHILGYFKNPTVNPDVVLMISATSKAEKNEWGKDLLDLANQNDCDLLRKTLQQNQKRRNFKSSILYYESNRQISNLKPLQFTWEYNDPFEEQVGWDFSFKPLTGRAQDTIHSIFKKIQSQKTAIANRAIQLKGEGKDSMNLEFSDPLDIFRKAFEQLLAPKKLLGVNIQGNLLRIADGANEINENSLSSGEREVLNIVFDFLLRRPSDCVVFFDEPELHLHPELANKLISALKTVSTGNQFIFCTHSAELLSGSLDNSVVFIQPQVEAGVNQAISVSIENETYDALRSIGQSIGVVSLGKKIVLVEGINSSLDKKTYLQIIKGRFPNLVLVPCEGKYTINSFGHIAESVLNRTVWGVEFFMLSDRDSFPDELESKISDRGLDKKIKSLSKYHLENYFLDEDILADVFSEMEEEGSWLRDPEQISDCLKEIASERVSYLSALTVSKLLRDTVGNVDLMIKGCNGLDAGQFSNAIAQKASEEINRISGLLDETTVNTKATEYFTKFEGSIDSGTWKNEIPGKQVFRIFASKSNMDEDRLKTLYIKKALTKENGPFDEIVNIFEEFSKLNHAN